MSEREFIQQREREKEARKVRLVPNCVYLIGYVVLVFVLGT